MSEYQYYEFLALDRPLTREEMAALRDISSRAAITPTHFTNHYEWGDLKADPLELLRRYFDVFVYVANWGTRWVALRVPKDAFPFETARPYLPRRAGSLHDAGTALLISLVSEDEEMDDWDDGSGWMASLTPLRGELLAGDLRPLYLAWLCCVQQVEAEDVEDDALEPPLPPGLAALTPAQECLADFLRLDPFVLDVAAESSEEADFPAGLDDWIAAQPQARKDRWLQELAAGRDPHVRATLLRRFREEQARAVPGTGAAQPRTAGELRAQADARREAYERDQARRAEAERRRREAEATRAREAYLTQLAGRQERAWADIEQWAHAKQPKGYDRAVALLQDLRDVARGAGAEAAFTARLADFAQHHGRKPSLLERLRRVGLMSTMIAPWI